MTLVNLKHKEMLTLLKNKLLECIKNDLFVNVHIYTSVLKVSHCIVPDDIIIDNELMITQGNFETLLNLESVHNIEYSEFDDEYHIHSDDIDIYFGFN